jgi:hypothetical protein
MFLKTFQRKLSKNIWQLPFCDNWKTSIAIWKVVTVGWQPKHFGCHKDGWLNCFGHPEGGTRYGNQIFLVSPLYGDQNFVHHQTMKVC